MSTMENFSTAQRNALAIVPKFTAFLSIFGSSMIVSELLCLDRSKLRRVHHRLILALSLSDIVVALGFFLSTWPIPRGTPDVSFAVGNQQTCTFQGFLLQFGLMEPLINMCLAVYYVLVITYSWSEDKIRRRAEPWFHVVSFSLALGTASAGIFLDLYNSANLWCWIAPLPNDCRQSLDGKPTTCERGDNADIYRWAFYYAVIWAIIILVTIAMVVVYRTFVKLEKANAKYATSLARSTTRGKRRRVSNSRKVAVQGIYYVLAFLVTFIFPTLNRFVQEVWGVDSFGLFLLHVLFIPSQGFWNFLVYIRPRYLHFREEHEESTRWFAFKEIFLSHYREFVSDKTGEDQEDEARKEFESYETRRGRAELFEDDGHGEENGDSSDENDEMYDPRSDHVDEESSFSNGATNGKYDLNATAVAKNTESSNLGYDPASEHDEESLSNVVGNGINDSNTSVVAKTTESTSDEKKW